MSLSASCPAPRRSGRRTLLLALATPLWLLSGCAGLPLGPDHVLLSEADLARRLAERFPFQKRYLELFDIQLSDPRLRLMPESNRLGTRFSYGVGGAWLGQRGIEGLADFSYALRFEPSDASVRLSEVRLDSFELPGAGAAQASQLRRVAGLVAEQWLEGQTIYRVPPERLQRAQGLGWQPAALQVVPGGVLLQLQPIKKP
jgi:hypothetical protein